MRTIVLLSGGLDSATVLAGCVADRDECLAIGFDYDQPHRIELDAAEEIAAHYGVAFQIIGLPAMLSSKVDEVVFAGRNFILASLAVAIAQARGFDRIAVGCNASDWPRFPDCRPEFWRNVSHCAESYGIAVLTPLIYMSKRDVVEAARKLNVPIEKTWSCYDPQEGRLLPAEYWHLSDFERQHYDIHGGSTRPCGKCLACKTRDEALAA